MLNFYSFKLVNPFVFPFSKSPFISSPFLFNLILPFSLFLSPCIYIHIKNQSFLILLIQTWLVPVQLPIFSLPQFFSWRFLDTSCREAMGLRHSGLISITGIRIQWRVFWTFMGCLKREVLNIIQLGLNVIGLSRAAALLMQLLPPCLLLFLEEMKLCGSVLWDCK